MKKAPPTPAAAGDRATVVVHSRALPVRAVCPGGATAVTLYVAGAVGHAPVWRLGVGPGGATALRDVAREACRRVEADANGIVIEADGHDALRLGPMPDGVTVVHVARHAPTPLDAVVDALAADVMDALGDLADAAADPRTRTPFPRPVDGTGCGTPRLRLVENLAERHEGA